MQRCARLTLLLLLLLSSSIVIHAQENQSAQQSVESLRSQLRDVEAKQAALEERSRQLDEEMRPENIERSLALTGSARPEELRAQRRQQLEKEKAGVQAQLEQLAASRARLQAALATAETAAYQQSANVNANSNANTNTPAQNSQPAAASGNQAPTVRAAPPQTRSTRRRTRRARARRRAQ